MRPDKPYEVGYKKPPKATRFVKGRSGNPNGRPKGTLNLATTVNKALAETVTIIEQGRRKKISKLDATIKGMINRAVKGDAKAVQQLLSLAPLVGIEAPGSQPLGEADAAVMASLIKRMNREGAQDDGAAVAK